MLVRIGDRKVNGRCRSRFTAPPPPLRRGSRINKPPRYGGGDGCCIGGGEGSHPISTRYGRNIVKWRNYRDFKNSRHGIMVGLIMHPAAYVSKKEGKWKDVLVTILLPKNTPAWMGGGSLSVVNSTHFPFILPNFSPFLHKIKKIKKNSFTTNLIITK